MFDVERFSFSMSFLFALVTFWCTINSSYQQIWPLTNVDWLRDQTNNTDVSKDHPSILVMCITSILDWFICVFCFNYHKPSVRWRSTVFKSFLSLLQNYTMNLLCLLSMALYNMVNIFEQIFTQLTNYLKVRFFNFLHVLSDAINQWHGPLCVPCAHRKLK